jgi:hypothetical protein
MDSGRELPLTDTERAELDVRLVEHERDPDAGFTWKRSRLICNDNEYRLLVKPRARADLSDRDEHYETVRVGSGAELRADRAVLGGSSNCLARIRLCTGTCDAPGP